MGIPKEQSPHISMEQNLCSLLLNKLSVSTQLDVYSPSPLNLPVSKCYAQLPSPNVAAETQQLPFIQRCAHFGCSSWLSSFKLTLVSEKLSCTKILLTFRLRLAAIPLNYRVKNIRNNVCQIIYIYIYKITIQLTSVGLAHAHPNYKKS